MTKVLLDTMTDIDFQSVPSEGAFADGDKTKLDGIEALADVTDTTNVTAAGALMDSEVTNLSGIKTLTVPDSTTITAAAATVLDDTTVSAMVNTLGGATATGTGGLVRATSPTLVTPLLGTPTSGNLANCTFPTLNQNTTGSAATLTTTRTIGGSNFNGSANVTSFPSPGAIGGTTPAAGTFTTLVAGSATSLLLGTAGSAVGSVGFRNATSGTITLSPPTGALGTVTLTLPAATDTLVGKATTDTLTNKRITPRVGSTTSSATPTINTDSYDAYSITALAAAITSMTTNLSGTPTDFQKLIIRIKDDGTARAITWGSSFVSRGATLPTTTVISKYLYIGLIYNSTAAKWDCVAVANEA